MEENENPEEVKIPQFEISEYYSLNRQTKEIRIATPKGIKMANENPEEFYRKITE